MQINSMRQAIQAAEENVKPDVEASQFRIKSVKAMREILVRNGKFLPSLKSKFLTQKIMIQMREGHIFCLDQNQVIFKECCTPPRKEVLVKKYINYAAASGLPTGIDLDKKKFPDKEYLIFAIATMSMGKDEIFKKNYVPPATERPRLGMDGITLNNQDGFFDDLPKELFAHKGGRAMNMATLSKDDKVRAQIVLA